MKRCWLILVFILLANPARAQYWTSHDSKIGFLEGNWQSCRECWDDRGNPTYCEKIYDGKKLSWGNDFEFHLGPEHEFALFKGFHDEDPGHYSDENLLIPTVVTISSGLAWQVWELPILNLKLSVVLSGGSRDDCESWYVILEKIKKPQS